jgi:hypothetical protein
MFERYTEIARRVILSSRQKAAHVGSPDIDTEHLLLGLLLTDKGLARRFLGQLELVAKCPSLLQVDTYRKCHFGEWLSFRWLSRRS